MVILEAVEQALDLGLVARVERAADAGRRPALVDAAVLRARRVRADRRRVDERGDSRGGGRPEHARAPLDVHLVEKLLVAARLDQPGQVHDRVGALEERPKRGAGDVGLAPLRLREARLGNAARYAEHRIDGRLLRERAQDARPDVATRAYYYDSHSSRQPRPGRLRVCHSSHQPACTSAARPSPTPLTAASLAPLMPRRYPPMLRANCPCTTRTLTSTRT